MRLMSLLLVVLVVAWLAYTQLGGGASGSGSPPAHRQAQQKAAQVEVQVQEQFAEQAGQLSRMEQGGAGEQP